MDKSKAQFLEFFPDHVYRYIDQTGSARPPISSAVRRDDLNLDGYEAYFTVNGFANFKDRPYATIDDLTSINSFWVDIDGRKDQAELEDIKKKIDPTFILETGNGHHIYWLLDEPIYKNEVTPAEWQSQIARWNTIEQAVVKTLNGDENAKDLARIMRIPNTYYWKKTGDRYKQGIKDVFKIKGVYKMIGHTYSMDKMADIFPTVDVEVADFPTTIKGQNMKTYADTQKKDFFDRVNKEYPIEQRPSFQKLISGEVGTLPPNTASRNTALLVTASLMRQANWPKVKAIAQIEKTGWHGIEKERGGSSEIVNTINSAYSQGYTFSYKNEIIAFNMTPEEQQAIQEAYTKASKDRKEIDKVRISIYEQEIFSRYPNLKKNEASIFFDYKNGVYTMVSDQQMSNIVFQMLLEDMMWGYRTKKHVADRLAALASMVPDFEITDDKGTFVNLKNGLLNIYTREMKPHTPNFVSLVQCPVNYFPEATCPTWLNCLDAWMAGPECENKKTLLQQFTGYCLTSSMRHSKALFLVGDGGNGKSTFADTIGMVIGDQGTSRIDLEDLYSTFGLKGLIGKRLNIVEEVSGNYYQSHKLKKLISGEELTINMKFKDQFKFKPQAKFIFAVNTMPRVDDSSTATERRIAIVQFNNNFRDRTNTLLRFAGGLLAQELSGILNWMIDGVQALTKTENFVVTTEQKIALSEYREENSSVEGFISECLAFTEKKLTSVRELYEEYKQYCIKDGRKFKGNIVFTKEMKAYSARHGKFTFIERVSGHGLASFEGVEISRGWSGVKDAEMNSLNRHFPTPLDL